MFDSVLNTCPPKIFPSLKAVIKSQLKKKNVGAHESAKSRACVLTCMHAYVLCVLACLFAHVLPKLTCLLSLRAWRADVLVVLTFSGAWLAYVFTELILLFVFYL